MRNLASVLIAVAAVGCGSSTNPRECSSSSECDLSGMDGTCRPAGGASWCAYPDSTCPTGERWGSLAGDGLASTCVVGSVADASVADAAGADASLDAGVIDAGPTPDGGPPQLVFNGQPADLVLGQSTFTTSIANLGGESASSLSSPMDVATDGTRLWVADYDNARVLQWDSLPDENQTPADRVIGQTSMTSHTPACTATLIGGVVGLGEATLYVAAGGGRVLVSDTRNHRGLIWNPIPATNGAAASLAITAPSLTTCAFGDAANEAWSAGEMWTDGTRLVMVDTYNSRVLIWQTFPTTVNQPADNVIGWSSFAAMDGGADPPTASSLSWPSAVFFDGARLYVVDTGNNRVLVWDGIPTTDGAPADFVIGQTNFTTRAGDLGAGTAGAVGLQFPTGIVAAHGSLFIADTGNHRVVVHTPVPETSGEPADFVLGKSTFTEDGIPSTPSATVIGSPGGMAVLGDKLFVADNDFNRVLRFDLAVP